MTVTKKNDAEKLILAIEGKIDTASAPALEKEVMAATDETADLVLDFADVTYISSSGLRVLLKAQKKMNAKGKLVLVNVSDAVKDVLDLTGFIDILTIE